MPQPRPHCRATVRDGQVTLNPWFPQLIRTGPRLSALDTVDAAVADLDVLPGDELVVRPVPRVPWPDEAGEAIVAWAALVGFRRVWLPGDVVDVTPATDLGRAAVDCPTCGAHWEDEDLDFWEVVRDAGAFPGRCRVCGGSLPEWVSEPVGAERH
jgi:hypothetical protein